MRRGDDRVIRLASGERRSALRAEVQDFEGARLLLAAARTDDPAVAGFRRTGQLKVASGGVTYAISARGAEQAAVDRFFSACNRA